MSRDLVNSFNAAYKEGELSISQRRGVITLVPEEDSGLSNLSNWRPITPAFKFRLQGGIKSNNKKNRKDFTKNNSS